MPCASVASARRVSTRDVLCSELCARLLSRLVMVIHQRWLFGSLLHRPFRGLLQCLLLSILITGGCRSTPLVPDPSPELRARTFDFYWAKLGNNYHHFEHANVDWFAVRERYRDRAINAPDVLSYYQALSLMVSELRDPHAYFISNRFPARIHAKLGVLDNYRPLEVRTVRVGRRHYIRNWGQSHAVPVGEDHQYPLLVRAGGVLNQSPFTEASDVAYWAHCDREVTIEALYADGDKRRLEAAPDIKLRRLLQHKSTLISVQIATPRDVLMSGTPVAVPALPEFEFTRISAEGGASSEPKSGRSVCDERAAEGSELFVTASHRVVIKRQRPWWIGVARGSGAGTNTGYIRLSTFDDSSGGLRRDFSGELELALKELHGVTSIIIDLRRNNGGVDVAVLESLAWFLPKDALANSRSRLRHLFNRPFSTHKGAFSGQVVLLVDDCSASAAEVFAWVMRELRQSVLVGETTAGAGAGVRQLFGPDGSFVQYGGILLNDDFDPLFQTVGITPDVAIPLTIERVREIGYARACAEIEVKQFEAACAIVGVDPQSFLRAP
jgi:C-terminal processing protease CtpA/Prc